MHFKNVVQSIMTQFVLQWVVKGAIDVNIGANPSAKGSDEEVLEEQPVKVVDIVDTFRLQVKVTKTPHY